MVGGKFSLWWDAGGGGGGGWRRGGFCRPFDRPVANTLAASFI